MPIWIFKGEPTKENDYNTGGSVVWYDLHDEKRGGAQKGDRVFFWNVEKLRFSLWLAEIQEVKRLRQGRYKFDLAFLARAFPVTISVAELAKEDLFDVHQEDIPCYMVPGPIQARYSMPETDTKPLAELVLRKNPEDEAVRGILTRWFPGLQKPKPLAPEELEPEASAFPEGKKAYVTHVRYERKTELVEQTKQKHRNANRGRLPCSVCGFDFEKKYGSLGKDFAEVHHTVPLSAYEKLQKQTTSVGELVVVCSNCHRMLHRRRPWLTVEALGELIE